MPNKRALSRLHYELIRGLVGRGVCPATSELAHQLEVSPARVEELLRSLADMHGIALRSGIVVSANNPIRWSVRYDDGTVLD